MIVILQGGTCNQLWQYAFGRSVSIARNEELLFKGRFNNVGHNRYALKPFNVNINFVDALLTQFTGPLYREKGFDFDPGVYDAPKGSIYDGFWQSWKYMNEPVLREELRIMTLYTPERLKRTEPVVIAKTSCFIHVRRGDYLKSPHKEFHGNLGMDYYNEAKARIRDEYPETRFFVFSDDPEWCKTTFPDDTVIEGTDQYEDLNLMKLCHHGIISNSTFGWFGAWMGDEKPNRMVIGPKKWFANSGAKDIMPDRWLKI